MKDNILLDLSMDFSVKIVNLCDSIKGHYTLTNQLERASTSIGANIREGNYAHSKADFISKFQIALKECFECEYWLELMAKTNLIDCNVSKSLIHDCGVIRKILISSINTTKKNLNK